jgi:hypothetical protein
MSVTGAFNQWKFVHGLLKEMVQNTITSMVYVRQVPDGVAYISSGKDLQDAELKRTYFAFTEAFKKLKTSYGFKEGKAQQVMIAMQTMMTIANFDRVYRDFVIDFNHNIRNLTPEQIATLEKEELPTNVPMHNFVVKR